MGDGIYLAERFEYSARYARRSACNDIWKNGMYQDSDFYVVGICEVISSPSIIINKELGVCVVPKEAEGNVAVRYLLVSNANKDLSAAISNGHILSHGDRSVDLSQHHENIRGEYASNSCFE